MPVLNQVEFTRDCVESILKYTPQDFEFIIIDNASTDGTAEYLKGLQDDSRFKIIRNNLNKGVSASWTQGIRASKHDHVCIINNDIIVLTPNWLSEMMKTLTSKNTNRWVSPRTCYNLKKRHQYKKTHYEQLVHNTTIPDNFVVGCCFLCPKSVFEQLGYFDEQFDIRYYEDLDYISRILDAGLTVEMCPFALIYHAVGATSRKTAGGEDNEKYYAEKWGHTKYSLDFWRGKY